MCNIHVPFQLVLAENLVRTMYVLEKELYLSLMMN